MCIKIEAETLFRLALSRRGFSNSQHLQSYLLCFALQGALRMFGKGHGGVAFRHNDAGEHFTHAPTTEERLYRRWLRCQFIFGGRSEACSIAS